MNLCEVTYEWREEVLIASLAGEIDMSNADELRAALLARMPNHARGLLIDLSGVTYMDSAGIHAAYELRDNIARRGQVMRLVVPEGSVVEETLRLADLDRGVGLRASVEDALTEMPVSAGGSDDR